MAVAGPRRTFRKPTHCASFLITALARIVSGEPVAVPATTRFATGCSTMN